MNASSIEGTQLAGVSNVALASLQVALVQQAQFKQTLEETVARRQEDLRATSDASKSDTSSQDSAPGGTRAVENTAKNADSGTQTGDGGKSDNPAGSKSESVSSSVGGSSGSLNIKV